MTHHDDRHAPDHDLVDQVTPFDEVTDMLDERDAPGHDDDLVRIERLGLPPAKVLVILVAILLAPILALPFGLNAALLVLVLAMGFTTWMAWDGASSFVPEQATLLRRAAMINAIVGLMALALLLIRLLG